MMIWKRVCLLFLVVVNGQPTANDRRSVRMSIMNGWQFQCSNTTCLPFINVTVSSVRACQMACLNYVQCQAASFYLSTSNCQLFNNTLNQNGTMLPVSGMISMSVISGTRVPIVIVRILINPCFNNIYWNVTSVTVAGDGTGGNALNELSGPWGIYLDSNNSLYVADRNNNRVMKYLSNATNGTVVAGMTGASGAGLNLLNNPSFVYIDSNQNLYIADTFNNRIVRWASGASNGSLVAGNGAGGLALTRVTYPVGVWVDSNSTVFVAEWATHRVTKWLSGASSGVLVAGVSGSSGTTPSKLYNPAGLVYDEINQDLYIATGMTIIRWHLGKPNGTFIAGSPGVSGSNATLLNNPNEIILDQWKNLYVADTGNNRVQLFCNGNTTGITVAGTGTGGSNLTGPMHVNFDSEMNLYVCESGGNRVTKFAKLYN